MSLGQPREARGSGASLDLARGGSRGGVAGLADGAEGALRACWTAWAASRWVVEERVLWREALGGPESCRRASSPSAGTGAASEGV